MSCRGGWVAAYLVETLEISPENLEAAIRDRLVDKKDVVVEIRGSRELFVRADRGSDAGVQGGGGGVGALATEKAGVAMSRRFRRRDARTTWEMHYGPSMTPMCDVVLVILVYFMASTSLAGRSGS